MRSISIITMLLAFALGCAQGGNFQKSSRAAKVAGKAIPSGAIASILPNAGGCPPGYSVPSGWGNLAKLCVHNYDSGSVQVLEDVKLVNGPCAVDYMLISTFGSQSFCVKSASVGQQTAIVTMLYEVSGLCAVGDTLAGSESAVLSMCEAH